MSKLRGNGHKDAVAVYNASVQSSPGWLGCDTATAVLGECIVHEEIDNLEDRQRTGSQQQTDEAAQLTWT